MLTPIKLKEMTGIQDVTRLTENTNGINDTLIKFNINTPLRECHFMAQLLHESGNLQFVKENLNYSAKGLVATFKKYFNNEAAAIPYARQPDKIANKVYGGRMGNGPESSGDGAKFKGRGFIQLTGRDNYTALTKATGIDFVNHPEFLEKINYASMSAGWYWDKNGLNALADKDDVLTITKRINGGTIGLESRIELLNKVKKILNVK